MGIAVMAINATGFYWIMGLTSALETLGSQLYGQGRFVAVGLTLQTALIVIGTLASPNVFVWWYLGDVLEACGVSVNESIIASRFARVMILGLPAIVLSECLRKYMTAQGIMSPFFFFAVAIFSLHLMWLFIFVYELKLGVEGAALAWVFSFWSSFVMMLGYILWKGIWRKNGLDEGWDWDCLKIVPRFTTLAVSGAIMLVLEAWGFEIITLLAGTLGAVELATQTVLTNTESCFFMIPLGIGTACATRVGQLLGQSQPIAASRALRVALGLSLTLTAILMLLTLIGQNLWVNLFTSDQDTKVLFFRVFPLQILVFVLNAVQGVLSGALRGCGRQMDGAYCNLLSFWAVGFPWVFVLTFVFGWGLFGLWNGLSCGIFLQSVVMLRFFSSLDWEAEAAECAKNNDAVAAESPRCRGGAGRGGEGDGSQPPTDKSGILVEVMCVSLVMSIVIVALYFGPLSQMNVNYYPGHERGGGAHQTLYQHTNSTQV